MFLKKTIKKNKLLIKYVFDLHQNKIIAPNTYIIDLDALLSNAQTILEIAKSNNIELLYLPKQFAHIPIIAKKLQTIGYGGVIVNSYNEFKHYRNNQVIVSSVGYFSQIPNIALEEIINSNLDFITVYSLEKMKQINKIAHLNNKIINIVIRVINQEKDIIFENQAGGFLINELPNLVKTLKYLKNIKIIGLTTSPCFIYHWEIKQGVETPNFFTLKKAQHQLKELGIDNIKLFIPTKNLFEANSFLALINFKEENNFLKGLTKLGNNYNKNQEIPSTIFLSEVSHNYNGKAYIFSNRVYFNSHLVSAIIGNKITNYHHYKIQPFNDCDNIYYLTLDKPAKVSSTAILAFDWQMISNKSHVAIISGIQNNNPKILGIYNCSGQLMS